MPNRRMPNQACLAVCVPCEETTQHLRIMVEKANPDGVYEALYCIQCRHITYKDMDAGQTHGRVAVEGEYAVVKEVNGKYVVGIPMYRAFCGYPVA